MSGGRESGAARAASLLAPSLVWIALFAMIYLLR